MTCLLEKKIQKRKMLGNLRELTIPSNPLIDFASNDYLGLASSPILVEMVNDEIGKYAKKRYGSTGSRLLTGNSQYAEDLEAQIAAFHGYEAGVIFNCGYMANIGLLSAVINKEDLVYYDLAIHASTHDGIQLSKANAFPFRHNDLGHLEMRLKTGKKNHEQGQISNTWICIESLYSMDGSKAPLTDICRLAKKYGANVIVDEAHSIGVYGPNGRGLVAENNLTNDVFAQINTFGKALGVHGAIVLGSNLLKQALINFANSYIYSTALSMHFLAAIKCSYKLFAKNGSRTQTD